ncbi:hypothetical protein C8R44DRAFT_845703 [Mycena epipterygia]|nr:hypothetical protein C8R44DRAFT_845703 [Mycena epipterygia]
MHRRLLRTNCLFLALRHPNTHSTRYMHDTLPVLATTLPVSLPTRMPTKATRPFVSVSNLWDPPGAAPNSAQCENFRRSPNEVPGGFQTNWEEWDDYHVFSVPWEWHDATGMFYQDLLGIEGSVRPLAFLRCSAPCFLFEAGGKYYRIDAELDDFPGDLSAQYYVLHRQQESLAKEVRERIQRLAYGDPGNAFLAL